MSFQMIRRSVIFRCISLISIFIFLTVNVPRSYAGVAGLPQPGTMMDLSHSYLPLMLKGLTVHPENPLLMDFILNTGNTDFGAEEVKKESNRLIKYFLACLTIPENNQWVNLSPYEKDRIIPEDLGQTELGRDMLAQDYILKQLTASLIYPEKNLGKKFWDKVYTKSQQMFGTSQIPVNTFNKVWILPDSAKVYQHKNTVYLVKSHLKVMLEEDYRALRQAGLAIEKKMNVIPAPDKDIRGQAPAGILTGSVASSIIKEIILPQIEEEVNQGQNFANLRQIYSSMILAVWYKKNLKEALLNQVYTDKGKINGVDVDDKTAKEKIYKQYLEAYKKGVFNFIKEETEKGHHQPVSRKYFSGGLTGVDAATLTEANALDIRTVDDGEGSTYKVVVRYNPSVTGENGGRSLKSIPFNKIVEFPVNDSSNTPVSSVKYVQRISTGGEDYLYFYDQNRNKIDQISLLRRTAVYFLGPILIIDGLALVGFEGREMIQFLGLRRQAKDNKSFLSAMNLHKAISEYVGIRFLSSSGYLTSNDLNKIPAQGDRKKKIQFIADALLSEQYPGFNNFSESEDRNLPSGKAVTVTDRDKYNEIVLDAVPMEVFAVDSKGQRNDAVQYVQRVQVSRTMQRGGSPQEVITHTLKFFDAQRQSVGLFYEFSPDVKVFSLGPILVIDGVLDNRGGAWVPTVRYIILGTMDGHWNGLNLNKLNASLLNRAPTNSIGANRPTNIPVDDGFLRHGVIERKYFSGGTTTVEGLAREILEKRFPLLSDNAMSGEKTIKRKLADFLREQRIEGCSITIQGSKTNPTVIIIGDELDKISGKSLTALKDSFPEQTVFNLEHKGSSLSFQLSDKAMGGMDEASTSSLQEKKDSAALALRGGIDLASKNLKMESEGEEINTKFDGAMIADFKKGDFSGLQFKVLDVSLIPSILPVLGLKENEEFGKLAKV